MRLGILERYRNRSRNNETSSGWSSYEVSFCARTERGLWYGSDKVNYDQISKKKVTIIGRHDFSMILRINIYTGGIKTKYTELI